MPDGVQAHDVGGAESAGLRAPQLGPGEVVDNIEAQAEFLGLAHRGKHLEGADPVGDEIGRVLGADAALAQRGRQEGLELVEHFGRGVGSGDQFDQVHIARRIEEMHAAESGAQRLRNAFAEPADRQARGIAAEDRVRADEGRDLRVQVVLPVHALGDRLDHQFALAQPLEVFVVVGGLDESGQVRMTERRRVHLLQALDGAQRHPVARPLAGRQIEQQHAHARIDQMGRNLRPHHPGAQHRDFPDDESTHAAPLILHDARFACAPAAACRCSRALPCACRRRSASSGCGRPCHCSDPGSGPRSSARRRASCR